MKHLKGSITVEASYIVPLVFTVFIVIIYSTFYFHDKNIMRGALYEVEAIIGQRERIEETKENWNSYFEERLGDKLILFSGCVFETEMLGDDVILTASASKGVMRISTQGLTRVIKPERHIRKMRNIDKLIGG